ncbi:MAG: hypothetical protein ACTSO9_09590 [Candidatus Helarchaeota archaeon]
MFTITISQKEHQDIWNNLDIIIPYMKPWIKQQRWAGLSSVEIFKMNCENSIVFKEQPNLKILGFFLSVNVSNEITSFFLPLIFFLDKKDIECSPELVIKTESSEIYSCQAEASSRFIELLINDFRDKKTYKLKNRLDFNFELEDEDFLNYFNYKDATVFKKGETTNFLTKIYGKNSNLFLKSYRKYQNSREPILIRELFRMNFANIPKPIGFAKLINGKEKICFYLQEFIPFNNDLGYYFWQNLNNRIIHPREYPTHMDDSEMNLFLLKLVDLVVEFHQKSSKIKNPSFEKEKFTKIDINKFKDAQLKIVYEILERVEEDLRIFNPVPGSLKQIQKDVDVLEEFIGLDKIAVHQDLHLAQVLVKISNKGEKELFITDLEGDPNRPINEIWERDLVFRDLASLITAFHYIEVNSVLNTTKLTKENLKNIESFTDAKNRLKSKIPNLINNVRIAKRWTDYAINNLIELYHNRIAKIFNKEKKEGLDLFKKGCQIYKFDRLIREIFYELKFRKDNYVVPMIILNNSFDSSLKI